MAKQEAPEVHKTYKLFIGGQFPRSESGRTIALEKGNGRKRGAQICRGSRKDFRNAVEAARKARSKWSGATALLRGQILHRISEMLYARRSEFAALLVDYGGLRAAAAEKDVDCAADRVLWYAGWADKILQVTSTVNPVPGRYFNFSMTEATGVIATLPGPTQSLAALCAIWMPVLVSGNVSVSVVSPELAPLAVSFTEVLATSDLPAGVFNLLTGTREELLEHVATHRDLDGIFFVGNDEERRIVEEGAADGVRRCLSIEELTRSEWLSKKAESLAWIEAFLETKTAWHSMGR